MPIQPIDPRPVAVAMETIVNALIPLFIDPAGGDEGLARAMICDQIDLYKPQSVPDLLRIGRIIGLRMAAVDNLRLSMDMNQDIEKCWTTAASLSKEADRMVESLNQSQAAYAALV